MDSHRASGGSYVVRELNIDVDMAPVAPADQDYVYAVMHTVCSLESPMPKLTAVINPGRGVYNIVFQGFNKNVSGKNAHRVFFGPDRRHEMDVVDDYYMNADRGTFTVRVWQQGSKPQVRRIDPQKKKRRRETRGDEEEDGDGRY